MLELCNVHFRFTTDILQDASFKFKPGLIYFLFARNGAGKSTLFKIINQELMPESGHVATEGRVILHKQIPIYFEDMTVRENLECFLELIETNQTYEGLRSKYRLEDIEGKVARKLSGGEKQRLYLAITGIGDDEIQLYDEADSALDAVSRKLYYDEVLRWNADQGKVVVAISHHVNEGLRVADRICFLTNRRLVELNPGELTPEIYDWNEDKIMKYLEKECEER